MRRRRRARLFIPSVWLFLMSRALVAAVVEATDPRGPVGRAEHFPAHAVLPSLVPFLLDVSVLS